MCNSAKGVGSFSSAYGGSGSGSKSIGSGSVPTRSLSTVLFQRLGYTPIHQWTRIRRCVARTFVRRLTGSGAADKYTQLRLSNRDTRLLISTIYDPYENIPTFNTKFLKCLKLIYIFRCICRENLYCSLARDSLFVSIYKIIFFD